jgi:hypothetical protein
VDDSPRYAARGRWQHAAGVSTWISDETWRPLPRREFSVRKDYDVLVGTNRHTITPTGWVQEENNVKLALDVQVQDGAPWERAAGEPQMTVNPPTPNARRIAMTELKWNGIEHVLLSPSSPIAADIRKDPKEWGLSLCGEMNGIRLYRID